MPEGRYVAKPQTVTAIQWTGDNAAEVKEWAGEVPSFEGERRSAFLLPGEMPGVYDVARWWFWVGEHQRKWVPVQIDHWMARGDARGTQQVFSPEEFAKRYEQAPASGGPDDFVSTGGHSYLHRTGRSEHDAHPGTCADYEEALRAVCLARLGRTPGVIADQPPPVPNDGPALWDLVLADMRERHQVGVQRYGTALQANNGRDMLVDAYQEILDLAVYLRGEIEERRTAGPRRGDAVEAWLKGQRDDRPADSTAWHALDIALDDYRLHADTGTSLDQQVNIRDEDR